MHKDAALSGIEYTHLIRELKRLEGGRINKIYQNKELFLFAVYTGDDRTNLLIEIPKVMYFTDAKPAMPDMPGGFCMFMRKRLQGSRVNEVKQRGSERIIEFHCSTREHEYIIICEMFGKGNLIICNSEYKIISAYESVTYQDRSIRGGQTYEYPDAQPDITSLSQEEFSEYFGDEQAVKVLASHLGLGGEYAELLCEDIDKRDYNPDTKHLYEKLQEVLSSFNPNYTSDRAQPIQMYDNATETETFSQALAELLDPQRKQQAKEEHLKKAEKKQNKYERIVTAQTKQIKGLTEAIEVNQQKGEIIYEHFSQVDTLLNQINTDKKEMEHEEFIKKYESFDYVKSIDGLSVTIDIGGSDE